MLPPSIPFDNLLNNQSTKISKIHYLNYRKTSKNAENATKRYCFLAKMWAPDLREEGKSEIPKKIEPKKTNILLLKSF